MSNCSAILWRELVKFPLNDDNISFLLNQRAKLDFYNVSSLKRKTTPTHCPAWFWSMSNQFVSLTPWCLVKKQQILILHVFGLIKFTLNPWSTTLETMMLIITPPIVTHLKMFKPFNNKTLSYLIKLVFLSA